MAKLGDLIVKIGADTRQFNTELGKLQRNIKSTADNITSLGKNMSMALTLPVVGLGAAAVKAAMDLQTMQTQFVSLTGGAEQAGQMVDRLNKFAAETPYEIEGIASAAKQLLAAGTDIDQVNGQLQFLGDIAAAAGVPIDEMAGIFAKVQAKGKVELENLNQLAERGIPIFTMLSEATGLLPSELGAGAVSVELFNQTLASMSAEGGFAFNAMSNLSQTAAGKFSTAMDALKMAGAELGAQLLPMVTGIIEKVTELSEKFTALDDRTKRIIVVVGGVVAAIGPAIVAFGLASKAVTAIQGAAAIATKAIGVMNAAMLTNPITAIALAVAAAVALIIANWDEIVAYFTTGDGVGVLDSLRGAFEQGMEAVKAVWAAAVGFLQAFWERFGGAIMQTIGVSMDVIMQVLGSAFNIIKGLLSAFTALFKGDWRAFLNALVDVAASMWQLITNTILGAMREIAGVVDLVLNALGIDSSIEGWLGGIQDDVNAFFDSIKSGAKESADSMKDLGTALKQPVQFGKVSTPTTGGGDGRAKNAGAITAAAGEFGTTMDEVLTDLQTESERIAEWQAGLADNIVLDEIEMIDDVVDDLDFDQVMFDKFLKIKAAQQEWGENLKQIIADIAATAQQLGAQFGTAFGQILTGSEEGKESMKAFASSAVDAAFNAATALAIQAAAQTSTAAGPGAAIVLPALITAGMALMREVFSGITGFADGGIVSGPTMGLVGEYPGARTNPEVIAPLDKLRSLIGGAGGNVVVTGRISGRDILISNQRTGRDANRYR